MVHDLLIESAAALDFDVKTSIGRQSFRFFYRVRQMIGFTWRAFSSFHLVFTLIVVIDFELFNDLITARAFHVVLISILMIMNHFFRWPLYLGMHAFMAPLNDTSTYEQIFLLYIQQDLLLQILLWAAARFPVPAFLKLAACLHDFFLHDL